MGLPFLDIAGAASSFLGGIFKGIQGGKQARMANAIHPVNAVYNSSPYAANQLSDVQAAYNGRMAGAGAAEQNIAGNFANSAAGVGRNSTNGSQSLAVLAGLNGQSNQAYSDLASKEAQNKQGLLGELGQANQGMTNESDKIYNDKLRNYNNDLAAKTALQQSSQKNKGAMFSDITDSLIGVGNAAERSQQNYSNSTGYSQPQSGGYIPQMQNSTGYINPFIR